MRRCVRQARYDIICDMTEFDFSILNWIQDHLRCGFLDAVMPKITVLGTAAALWIVIGLALLMKPATRRTAVLLFIALLTALLVCNLTLKNLVARDRPCWINKDMILLVKSPKDYSFPSGHTAMSFLSATVLTRLGRKAGVAAFVVATLIAFSRLYLYVHFPSDVAAGALIGTMIGVLVLAGNRWIEKKKEVRGEV